MGEKRVVVHIHIHPVDAGMPPMTYTKVYDQETSMRTVMAWAANQAEELTAEGKAYMVSGVNLTLED